MGGTISYLSSHDLLVWLILSLVLLAYVSFFYRHGMEKKRLVLMTLVAIISLGSLKYVFGLVVGHSLFATILIVGALHALEDIYHKLKSIPGDVKKELEEAQKVIEKAIPGALNSKQIFVTEVSHKKKLKKIIGVIYSNKNLANREKGIGIFCFEADETKYSEVCKHFLEKTEKTIEGMTDMDFDRALYFLKNGSTAAVGWIRSVNDKVKLSKNSICVHRVLILTEERHGYPF